MADSEDHPVLAQYQSINLAVVEVSVGETREEARRRYIAEHPESAGVDVKIFPTRTRTVTKHDDVDLPNFHMKFISSKCNTSAGQYHQRRGTGPLDWKAPARSRARGGMSLRVTSRPSMRSSLRSMSNPEGANL